VIERPPMVTLEEYRRLHPGSHSGEAT
jgi:hypothetical protein